MKKIGIIVNTLKTKEYVNDVISGLKGNAELFISGCEIDGVNTVEYEELFNIADYMLVMGGDGTIIRASGNCAKNNIPVLGINLGRIGFMTEIEPEMIRSAIIKLLNGEFKTERRMMIKAQIKQGNETIKTVHALNDIVVSKAAEVRMVGLELYTDEDLVNRYIADGLIISTPTGSTGYSISAGGPVVDPNMQLYIATPICAHMLAVRSAVLPSQKQLLIRQDKSYGNHKAIVTADGEICGEICGNDEVIITKSQYELTLIKIGNQSFYDTLIKKLS